MADWVMDVVNRGLPDGIRRFILLVLGPVCLKKWGKSVDECVLLAERFIENSRVNYGYSGTLRRKDIESMLSSLQRSSRPAPETPEDVRSINPELYEILTRVIAGRRGTLLNYATTVGSAGGQGNMNTPIYMKPHDLAQRELVNLLSRHGWKVYENVQLVKRGKYFYADIVALHRGYSELGCFLFEVKTHAGTFKDAFTAAHKQIVTRYIGSVFDHKLECPRQMPEVFIYYSPVKYKTLDDLATMRETIIRFFTEYGIGVLFPDLDYVIFHPEYRRESWAKLYIDPSKSDPNSIRTLKEKLERTYKEVVLI